MTALEEQRQLIARKRSYLRQQNRLFTAQLEQIPRDQWPEAYQPREGLAYVAVWRSCHFLVQVIEEKGHTRLSINRAEIQDDGRWKDNITWDELQFIKNSCGFAHHTAVEIYPPKNQTVNVANMRHLWVLPAPPPFMWGSQLKT